jgi:hypothetical protein
MVRRSFGLKSFGCIHDFLMGNRNGVKAEAGGSVSSFLSEGVKKSFAKSGQESGSTG